MRKLFVVALLLFAVFANSQTSSTKTAFTIPKKATVVLGDIKEDYFQTGQCIEKPVPGGVPQKANELNWSGNNKGSQNVSVASVTLPPIFLGKNFSANNFSNSTPTDNDIAVSNNCKVVSVSNTLVYYFDCASNSTMGVVSLAAFGSAIGSLSQAFDPKVAYDPVADRFSVVYLNGFAPASTSVIVGFSQTNNPAGAWNMYALPGNPFNNNLWTDYPQMSFSKDELFITVNLLVPGGSWQTSFAETIIWEINKKKGFAGLPLTTMVHNNIKWAGNNLRNICPVKGGSQLYGPRQYFLSNRNFGVTTDSLFLIDISDTIAAAGQTLTVKKLTTDITYNMPPDARQVPPHVLATNDARVLGAFIENNKIQYVHNTKDPGTNFCAVNYGIIHNVTGTPTVNCAIINDPVMDLGYPNISYAGTSSTDNTAIINYLHTAPSVFAGVSVIKTDANGNYSPVLKVKDGTGYVDLLGGNQERWGDYTGSQRKYNEPNKFWVNGYYGLLNGASHIHATWIAEIGMNFIATDVADKKAEQNLKVYPNPIKEQVTVKFKVNETDYLNFVIYDVNGKEVKHLMKEFIKEGTHEFSFSAEPLSTGVYFLKIFSDKQEFANQKIIKE